MQYALGDKLQCRSPHVAKVGKTARYLRLSVLDGDPGLWEFKVFN